MSSLPDSHICSTSTGTSVPGFHIPPLRGWSFSGACSIAYVRLDSARSEQNWLHSGVTSGTMPSLPAGIYISDGCKDANPGSPQSKDLSFKPPA